MQDTAFKFAHPLRVRIPQKFIKKREAIPKYHFSFGALQGIQAASRLTCSATVAKRQYPPHTSRLKTVHRTVFLTPLTLSGFESLNKKTEATQNCIASVLARCKGFEPLTFWFVAKHSIRLSYRRICNFYCSSILTLLEQKVNIFLRSTRINRFLLYSEAAEISPYK